MIRISNNGNWSKTTRFLKKARKYVKSIDFDKYGVYGVDALRRATPIDSGETADSWDYSVNVTMSRVTLSFHNSNIQNGVPIAIVLQYGHGTKNGGWVQGRDYINPAIQPIFDNMTKEIWKEVTKL